MDQNGQNGKGASSNTLAGQKADKVFQQRQFPIRSLDDVLTEIRRAGGTGKLEINFKDGQARGDAKWKGYGHESK
jgi:hypothetical protein